MTTVDTATQPAGVAYERVEAPNAPYPPYAAAAPYPPYACLLYTSPSPRDA